mmetsp:Transcript_47687/g.91074  ORF Transcript_47687/g.91074 Transcript_47687/m.91074 type:complete len:299 (-) Transcript_47687:352-1248(-)
MNLDLQGWVGVQGLGEVQHGSVEVALEEGVARSRGGRLHGAQALELLPSRGVVRVEVEHLTQMLRGLVKVPFEVERLAAQPVRLQVRGVLLQHSQPHAHGSVHVARAQVRPPRAHHHHRRAPGVENLLKALEGERVLAARARRLRLRQHQPRLFNLTTLLAQLLRLRLQLARPRQAGSRLVKVPDFAERSGQSDVALDVGGVQVESAGTVSHALLVRAHHQPRRRSVGVEAGHARGERDGFAVQLDGVAVRTLLELDVGLVIQSLRAGGRRRPFCVGHVRVVAGEVRAELAVVALPTA